MVWNFVPAIPQTWNWITNSFGNSTLLLLVTYLRLFWHVCTNTIVSKLIRRARQYTLFIVSATTDSEYKQERKLHMKVDAPRSYWSGILSFSYRLSFRLYDPIFPLFAAEKKKTSLVQFRLIQSNVKLGGFGRRVRETDWADPAVRAGRKTIRWYGTP